MKKGFTLVELLGVIIILGVISLITYPIIDKSIKNSKQQALDRTINSIEEAAYRYSVENDIGYSTEYQILQLSELISKGFLKENIINPVTDEQMQGCVLYRWDETNSQYIFEYDEECNKIETEPIVNITYNKELINNNGWAKENIAVTIMGNGEIKYCISSSECEPNEVIEIGNNTKFITTEGTNYICAIVSNSLGNSEKKCETINLDKTMPTINGINDIIVNKGEEINLTEGISVTDGLSGIEGNYSYRPIVIDNNVVGISKVTYIVKDKAGNETIKERKVEVIGEAPNITFTSTGTANSNGWYKENIYVKGNIVDNSKKGIKSIKWCSTTGTECTPNTLTEEINVLINNESSTNKICVEVIDNNNKVTTKCSDVYKLDKTQPTIEGIEDKGVQRNEIVDLKEGVTYNDSLSGIDGDIIITPSSVDTSVTGTKQVTYKVVDKAGNIREVVRNIIVDAEAPTITYTLVNSSSINSNGWAKNNFYVRATITDNSESGIKSAKSCSSNSSSECSPVASFTGMTKDFYVEVEGSNRLCIEVTDNNNKTSKVCSDTYKLDKTAPVAGTANIVGTLGSNNWYTSNVTINKINGSDSLSGHSSTTSNITNITSNTAGTTVTITTTDLAGNSSTRNYTIKVDKTSPTLTINSVNIDNKIIFASYNVNSFSGINKYVCHYGTNSNTTNSMNSSSNNCSFNNLINGTSYYYKICATNNAGITNCSSINNSTPMPKYVVTKSNCTNYNIVSPSSDNNPSTLYLNDGCANADINLRINYPIKIGDEIKITYSVVRTGAFYMSIIDNQHINSNIDSNGYSCDPTCSNEFLQYYIPNNGIEKKTKTFTAIYNTDYYNLQFIKNSNSNFTGTLSIYSIYVNDTKIF